MFSAFKKLTNKNEVNGVQNGHGGAGHGVVGEGVHSMSHNLQKKFAKGCNYNMKIVIRGDKNTGKSCLLNRLQGGSFKEDYNPTEEIQVESINWSYKNTEDIVKVEVWDIVDVAKKRKKLTGLKVGNSASEVEELEPGLDAQFLDVYKQTHGAILIFDITKPWTFDYVKSEVPRIPSSIPVLILANYADQGHHRQVTKLQIADFVENIYREGTQPAEVRWAECSLRNGFGLRFLHNFFNIPFLTLQRESLLRQLEQNLREIQATHDELDLYMESEAADYSRFSDNLSNRRRQAADQLAPAPTRSIIVGTSAASSSKDQEVTRIQDSSVLSYSNRGAPPPQPQESDEVPVINSDEIDAAKTKSSTAATSTASKTTSTALPTTTTATTTTTVGSTTSESKDEVSGLSKDQMTHKSKESTPVSLTAKASSGGSKVDVENFVPESGDFDNFLDDENTNSGASNNQNGNALDTSDDEDDGNPMVSKFDDDVHFDEYETGAGKQEYESL